MNLHSAEQFLLLANPWAGRGRALEIARKAGQKLQSLGHRAVVFDRHPQHLQQSQLPRPLHAVAIFGGDGTIRSGLDALRKLIDPLPPVLVYSTGTANLLAGFLKQKYALDPTDQIVASLLKRPTRTIDAGLANDMLFVSMVGAGFDAAVVHALAKARTGPISIFSYLQPTLRALVDEPFEPCDVDVDGRRLASGVGGVVLVSNLSAYGTGFPIALHAKPDDGLLDVTILPAKSQRQLLSHVLRAAAGLHLHEENVFYARGRQVQIRSSVPVPMQLDGDPAGFTPVSIEIRPAMLRLIV